MWFMFILSAGLVISLVMVPVLITATEMVLHGIREQYHQATSPIKAICTGLIPGVVICFIIVPILAAMLTAMGVPMPTPITSLMPVAAPELVEVSSLSSTIAMIIILALFLFAPALIGLIALIAPPALWRNEIGAEYENEKLMETMETEIAS